MRRFVRFSEKIQYLWFLGLLGLLVNNRTLKLFWLFGLFGFVPLFHNPSVFLQALKQLWGMLIIPLKYGANMPSADNYKGKIKYSLPFEGEWAVVKGGTDKALSHSWGVPTQRYAYDFLVLDEEGQSFFGERTKCDNYYCYNKEILAPADGEVIELLDECTDSVIMGNGKVDCSAKDIRGNYILIRHDEKEYSVFAHLKPSSIRVRKGDTVKRGQCIARCGNSGNSSEPHLHFQLQDGESFFTSAALPIEFADINIHDVPNYSAYDARQASIVKPLKKYIARGQNVSNI